jgi:AcrR family transcriptional regulator
MNKRSAEETKKRILAAAPTVFVAEGYTRASMRDIARASGISVGGLYLHFKSKEELYITLMRDWMKRLNDTTQEALARIEDPVAAFRAFISISIDFARLNREIVIMQRRELGYTLGIELKKEFFQERRRLIGDIVRKGIRTGAFRVCEPDEAAKVIFCMLRGHILSMAMDEEALFTPEACIDLALDGLKRRNSV